MLQDPFAKNVDSPIAPAEQCFAITPDDQANLSQATKAIYIGQGGDLAIVPVRGDAAVIFRNVVGGTILDVRVRAVRAAGTTAADLVGLA